MEMFFLTSHSKEEMLMTKAYTGNYEKDAFLQLVLTGLGCAHLALFGYMGSNDQHINDRAFPS